MTVTLQTERGQTLDQVRAFVEGSEVVDPRFHGGRLSRRPTRSRSRRHLSSLREEGAGGVHRQDIPRKSRNERCAMVHGRQAEHAPWWAVIGSVPADSAARQGTFPYHPPYRVAEGEHVHEQIDRRSPERALHGSRAAGTGRDGRCGRGSPRRPPRPGAPGWRRGRHPREPRKLRLGRGLPGNAAPLRTRHPARALGVRNHPGGPAAVLGRKGGPPPTERAA